MKKNMGQTDRTIRIVIAIILATLYFTGIINGKIIDKKIGDNGFGYDPIFVADNYTKTFAELTIEEKSTISHRGIAVKQLIEFLK